MDRQKKAKSFQRFVEQELQPGSGNFQIMNVTKTELAALRKGLCFTGKLLNSLGLSLNNIFRRTG